MDNKLLLLLAFDSMLLELDADYEGVPAEVAQLIESKVYESYGLEITSDSDNANAVKRSLIQDVKKYRDKLISELN